MMERIKFDATWDEFVSGSTDREIVNLWNACCHEEDCAIDNHNINPEICENGEDFFEMYYSNMYELVRVVYWSHKHYNPAHKYVWEYQGVYLKSSDDFRDSYFDEDAMKEYYFHHQDILDEISDFYNYITEEDE